MIKPGSVVYKKDNDNYYVDCGEGPGTFHAHISEPENIQMVLDYIAEHNPTISNYAVPDYIELDRINGIKRRLEEIDKQSIRALRAIRLGKGKQLDTDTLNALETEAEALRLQLGGQ